MKMLRERENWMEARQASRHQRPARPARPGDHGAGREFIIQHRQRNLE
jgi:hypothetical protein